MSTAPGGRRVHLKRQEQGCFYLFLAAIFVNKDKLQLCLPTVQFDAHMETCIGSRTVGVCIEGPISVPALSQLHTEPRYSYLNNHIHAEHAHTRTHGLLHHLLLAWLQGETFLEQYRTFTHDEERGNLVSSAFASLELEWDVLALQPNCAHQLNVPVMLKLDVHWVKASGIILTAFYILGKADLSDYPRKLKHKVGFFKGSWQLLIAFPMSNREILKWFSPWQ